MPDYSLCLGESDCKTKKCPVRKSCARYLGVPDEYRQSYLSPYAKEIKKSGCDSYWDVRKDCTPFVLEDKE